LEAFYFVAAADTSKPKIRDPAVGLSISIPQSLFASFGNGLLQAKKTQSNQGQTSILHTHIFTDTWFFQITRPLSVAVIASQCRNGVWRSSCEGFSQSNAKECNRARRETRYRRFPQMVGRQLE
jgi:hypothetical protein